jgi:hypothetical protein
VGAARAKYELPGGGFLMVIFDCWVENYVPANACSGYGNKATALAAAAALPHGGERQQGEEGAERDEALIYTCYADSKTKAFPVKRMMDYLDSVVRTASIRQQASATEYYWVLPAASALFPSRIVLRSSEAET